MMRQPCDLIIEGRAGASVYGVFAEARALAAQMGRNITVVGNSVRVTVTPDMTEEQCRYAYRRALVERESEKKLLHPAPERPSTITIEIGSEDWRFLTSAAQALELSPGDAIAAFWKIGASVYVAQALGYELPPDLTAWTPDAFVSLWKLWLAQQSSQRI